MNRLQAISGDFSLLLVHQEQGRAMVQVLLSTQPRLRGISIQVFIGTSIWCFIGRCKDGGRWLGQHLSEQGHSGCAETLAKTHTPHVGLPGFHSCIHALAPATGRVKPWEQQDTTESVSPPTYRLGDLRAPSSCPALAVPGICKVNQESEDSLSLPSTCVSVSKTPERTQGPRDPQLGACPTLTGAVPRKPSSPVSVTGNSPCHRLA